MNARIQVQKGDRIRLIRMSRDPDPIPPGTTGTVPSVHWWRQGTQELGQLSVRWDIRRSLGLALPEDEFEIIERPQAPFFMGDL